MLASQQVSRAATYPAGQTATDPAGQPATQPVNQPAVVGQARVPTPCLPDHGKDISYFSKQ